jgi:hypothetical protein
VLAVPGMDDFQGVDVDELIERASRAEAVDAQ